MPEARKREPVVPAKIKIVIKELLDQRVYDLAAAAAKADLTMYLARKYLKRPNVLRYFREERAAMLEEVCAGNAAALALVRATSDNGMAVTAACRQLELMRQTVAEEGHGALRQSLPGLVVIIESANGSPARIIAPPLTQIEHDPLSDRTELEPPAPR
jgi:DNA repair ATPase RecN